MFTGKESNSACGWPDIAPPVDRYFLRRDINALPICHRLVKSGAMEVWQANAHQIPSILREIGRLREMSFRAVQEGSGKTIDIDSYDPYYQHLFLWNTNNEMLIGAYRIAMVDQVLKVRELRDLYTRSLFVYNEQFINSMGHCLEIGRSFIRPEYQTKKNSLMLLWQGIAAFVVANPKYRVLFGTVSISNSYTSLAKKLMVDYIRLYLYDRKRSSLIRPSHPVNFRDLCLDLRMLDDLGCVDDLSRQVKRLEINKGMPVLLKHYIKLNGKFAGFTIDSTFGSTLDIMVIVDLMHIKPQKREKYMTPYGNNVYELAQKAISSTTKI